MAKKPFGGFQLPRQNWSKVPHQMIDALPEVETVGELKVILYILRHTWGYQEFEQSKKITVDEFMNGRKRKDGTRMDNGVGLSHPTVIDGLRRAEEHGFITVDVDDSDAARVKKFYAIRMEGSKDFTPDLNNLETSSKELLPRSEKDTFERNQEKEESKGAQAPDLPHNLSDWIQFVKDGQGQPGGMIARLGRMFATLYPDYEPDYGRIGTAARRVRGAKRLAHLCWLSQGYRVTGDPVDYCEGMHKGNGGSNGRDRSATQQDHNTPSPEELEELKRLVREQKAKQEAVS